MTLKVPTREDQQSASWQGWHILFASRPDTKPAIFAVSRSSEAYWRKEVIRVANKEEYDAAISRVKNSPSTASSRDWELTKKAASQAGSQGNQAREALNGSSQARSWF